MSDLFDYKCPSCGGAMEFDSKSQKMKCPYCDTEIAVEDMKSRDEELNGNQADTEANWSQPSNQWDDGETDNMSVFVCNSCGGEIVGDENTAATSCPYCGNPVVMKERFKGQLKPDYVIPFKLDKKQAMEKYKQHIKGKFLLPKLFKSQNHIDEIKGVYVPFWLYDSNVKANATFLAENIRRWHDSNYDYTETSYFSVYREGTMSFANIPCDGSSRMDDDLMESIEPFDFSQAVPFKTAYLAGYLADKYDVDEKENEPRANKRILESTIDVLRDTFKGRFTVVHNPVDKSINIPNDVINQGFAGPGANMSVLSGNIKYVLYPVWMLTSTYKGEKYTFAMNGQTGKFVGNLPTDKKKKWLTFFSTFAAASAIAIPIVYFFLG